MIEIADFAAFLGWGISVGMVIGLAAFGICAGFKILRTATKV